MSQYESYLSPFSWRYGSVEMRNVWSEAQKRRLWRRIWVALASVQAEYGLVKAEQVTELQTHAEELNIERALAIEAQIHHDLMAELKTFAEICPNGGGIIHMGATSMDIEDNADALRLRAAMDLVLSALSDLLRAMASRIDETAEIPVIAFTHIQPAEPSTLGYRLSIYAQDLFEDWKMLRLQRDSIRGKGFKGAVGTAAAYGDLLGIENLAPFEARMSAVLDLPFYPVSTQTYTRKQDYNILSALAGLGATLHKFAFDLRLLQTPPIGEISEPFGKNQVGSSAMPLKRNPINAEKIDSLARQLSVYPQVAWQNAANSLLERTLDDSANRRTILPESFLLCDELLHVSLRLVKGFNIHQEAIDRNMQAYAPFACTERVLMAVCKRGADRQEMHERLREHALAAWQVVQQGGENPLIALLLADPVLLQWITLSEIEKMTVVEDYTGFAPGNARSLAQHIRQTLDD